VREQLLEALMDFLSCDFRCFVEQPDDSLARAAHTLRLDVTCVACAC